MLVKNRFDGGHKVDNEINRLSDNGSCYIVDETLTFSKKSVYNESYPHGALKHRSPREFRQRGSSPTRA
ncbi:hypothetical protein [Caballeronia udeis]|uniref:hypothetical protein n=1 Tax=Caballeronia udeis TaxID=1232866 RepID=UPI000781EC23|nr:hypothetical protein [Caballeronia udeis]